MLMTTSIPLATFLLTFALMVYMLTRRTAGASSRPSPFGSTRNALTSGKYRDWDVRPARVWGHQRGQLLVLKLTQSSEAARPVK